MSMAYPIDVSHYTHYSITWHLTDGKLEKIDEIMHITLVCTRGKVCKAMVYLLDSSNLREQNKISQDTSLPQDKFTLRTKGNRFKSGKS